MKDSIKIFLSLIIGIIGMIVAKVVHPGWTQNQLLIFGLVVFVVTAILALLLVKTKRGDERASSHRYVKN